MYEFLFTAITACSLVAPSQEVILKAERDAAKKEKCEVFKESFLEDVTCTEGGFAKLINLNCYKSK